MPAKPVPTCGLCGRRLPDQKKRIYSRTTKTYYCGTEFERCRKLHEKRKGKR